VLFLSELGDLTRFPHPRKLMAYLGLLPSEYSSGDTVRKGRITKAGNGHVRWILIEAAQHYLKPPKVSQQLSQRQKGQPRRILEISWQAQNRLYRRYRTLAARGKTHQKAVTAIARELAGFLWAIYHEWRHPGSVPVRPLQGLKKEPATASAPPAPTAKPHRSSVRADTLHAVPGGRMTKRVTP
jgi:hypothetical protein